MLDNEVARRKENALLLSKYSEQIGEPFEVSTIRREDYRFHKGLNDTMFGYKEKI